MQFFHFHGNEPRNFSNRLDSQDPDFRCRVKSLFGNFSESSGPISIDLSYNPELGDSGVAEILVGVTNLQRLILKSCGVSMLEISLPLSLEELDLTGNHLGFKGGIALANFLNRSLSLRILRISDCDLPFDAWAAILHVAYKLTDLEICNPRMPPESGGQAVYHLCRLVEGNRNLRYLSVGKSCLRDEDIEELVRSIIRGGSIEHLDVSGNLISFRGVVELAKLVALDNFQILNIAYNNFGRCGDQIGLQSLSDSLKERGREMQKLDVRGNSLKGKALVDFVKTCEETNVNELLCFANDWTEDDRSQVFVSRLNTDFYKDGNNLVYKNAGS